MEPKSTCVAVTGGASLPSLCKGGTGRVEVLPPLTPPYKGGKPLPSHTYLDLFLDPDPAIPLWHRIVGGAALPLAPLMLAAGCTGREAEIPYSQTATGDGDGGGGGGETAVGGGGTWLQVSAGDEHTCGLRSDYTIKCWGEDAQGETDPPGGTFIQVSASYCHTSALRPDGTLEWWGMEVCGTLPRGPFTEISAGWSNICGIRTDSAVECSGCGDYEDDWSRLHEGNFAHVDMGDGHACAVRRDPSAPLEEGGTVACWGDNRYGQSSPPAGTFTQISAGVTHTCAVRRDPSAESTPSGVEGPGAGGTVACWGDNGIGESTPPAGIFTQVSGGYLHTCGIRPGGAVECWGYNSQGQSDSPAGEFIQISAGGFHNCGLRVDGAIACWGDNTRGQSTPPSP